MDLLVFCTAAVKPLSLEAICAGRRPNPTFLKDKPARVSASGCVCVSVCKQTLEAKVNIGTRAAAARTEA